MARWRAVPTAVSTAVGALAFLASAGLAVVLGAGLHVWSGPATPAGLGGHGNAVAPSVTGRVGGVVTVPAPAVRPQTVTPGPSFSLPFVPFVSAAAPAPVAAAPVPVPPVTAPAVPPANVSSGSPAGLPAARDLPASLRAFLDRLRTTSSVDETSTALRPLTHDRKAGRTVERARHRELPHGITASDRPERGGDRAAREHHGHDRGHGSHHAVRRHGRDEARHHHGHHGHGHRHGHHRGHHHG